MKQELIKKDIITKLRDKKECAFGILVKELNYPYHEILSSLLELKEQGKVTKSIKHHGSYVLCKNL